MRVIDAVERRTEPHLSYDELTDLATQCGLPSSPTKMDLSTEVDCLLRFMHGLLTVMVSLVTPPPHPSSHILIIGRILSPDPPFRPIPMCAVVQ